MLIFILYNKVLQKYANVPPLYGAIFTKRNSLR